MQAHAASYLLSECSCACLCKQLTCGYTLVQASILRPWSLMQHGLVPNDHQGTQISRLARDAAGHESAAQKLLDNRPICLRQCMNCQIANSMQHSCCTRSQNDSTELLEQYILFTKTCPMPDISKRAVC